MFTVDSNSEKRDLIRMNMRCDISVSTMEKQFTANCSDLSGNGICFTTPEQMDIGDVIDIDIYPVNSLTSPLFATAEIVWIRPERSEYQIGAQIRIKN